MVHRALSLTLVGCFAVTGFSMAYASGVTVTRRGGAFGLTQTVAGVPSNVVTIAQDMKVELETADIFVDLGRKQIVSTAYDDDGHLFVLTHDGNVTLFDVDTKVREHIGSVEMYKTRYMVGPVPRQAMAASKSRAWIMRGGGITALQKGKGVLWQFSWSD